MRPPHTVISLDMRTPTAPLTESGYCGADLQLDFESGRTCDVTRFWGSPDTSPPTRRRTSWSGIRRLIIRIKLCHLRLIQVTRFWYMRLWQIVTVRNMRKKLSLQKRKCLPQKLLSRKKFKNLVQFSLFKAVRYLTNSFKVLAELNSKFQLLLWGLNWQNHYFISAKIYSQVIGSFVYADMYLGQSK